MEDKLASKEGKEERDEGQAKACDVAGNGRSVL